MNRLAQLEAERFAWSLEIFPDATAVSSLIKLQGEIVEVEVDLLAGNDPTEEYADCLMCLFDSMNRGGLSIEDAVADSAVRYSAHGLNVQGAINLLSVVKDITTKLIASEKTFSLLLNGVGAFQYSFNNLATLIRMSAYSAGLNSNNLTDAFAAKLAKNKARSWIKNADNTYSHVKLPAYEGGPLHNPGKP